MLGGASPLPGDQDPSSGTGVSAEILLNEPRVTSVQPCSPCVPGPVLPTRLSSRPRPNSWAARRPGPASRGRSRVHTPQSPFKGIQARSSLHQENRTVSCSSERVWGGVPSEAGPLGRRAGWERRHLACNTALGALLWVGYLFLADFMQRRSIMNSIAFCVRAQYKILYSRSV